MNVDIKRLEAKVRHATGEIEKINALIDLAWSLTLTRPKQAKQVNDDALELAQKFGYAKGIAYCVRNQGVYQYVRSNYETACKRLETATEHFEKINDLFGQASALDWLGRVYRLLGDYLKASGYHHRSLEICIRIRDREGEAASLSNIGATHIELGDYANALDYFMKSLKVENELGNNQGMASVYTSIGFIYHKSADYENALDYHYRSLKLNQELSNRHGEARSYLNIGLAHERSADYLNSLDYYLQSLMIRKEINDRLGEAESLRNVGVIYERWEDYESAANYYQKSLEIFREIGNKKGEAQSLCNLGALFDKFDKNGDPYRALEYLCQSLKIAEAIQVRELIFEAHLSLSKVYENHGGVKKALHHYKRFHIIRETVMNDATKDKLKKMQVIHQVEQARKETDILRRKNKELRKLITAIETVEIGVTIADVNGRIIYVNPADAKMHGYEIDELIGQPANIFGPRENRSKLSLDALKKVSSWRREGKNYRKDGFHFPVSLISNKAVDVDNEPIGIVTICEDITQRKEAEKKLRNTNQELTKALAYLEELDREKSEFLEIASHDLKNPLTGIYGIVQMLLEFGIEEFPRFQIDNYLENIEKLINRMFLLISNLLDINRIESGEKQLSLKTFNLRSILTETINQNLQSAIAKNIKLILKDHGKRVLVYADESATQQVLDNLISNAIKYSRPGKHVYIELHPPSEVAVESQSSHSFVRCLIRDQGLGLTQEDKKKLFGKFSRLSAQPTGDENSTGLGLSIVKKLVEMMMGRVWAESPGKNKGSTFFLELPGDQSVSSS
ncbi:MAG: hypothetical protein B6244_10030 [Candidatus Cloacimonetes bacterium 4572_55]|nr:MAG: hypothetical protein B6244_10030 [Candidatus Cloacimonetes bacterium 4572_55]